MFRPILEKDAIKRQAAELLLVIISDGLAQMKRSDYPEMDNLFAAIESLRNFFAHPNPSGKSDFPIATPTRYINNYLSTLAQEVTIFSINIKFIFEEKFHINIDKTIFEVWAAFGTLPHKKIIIGNKQLLGVLPFESEQTIVKQIFSHLDRKTLHKSVPLVSKAWYRVYKDTAQNCGFNLRMSNLITPSIMKKSNNLLLQSKVACKSKVNHTFEFDGSSYVPFENIHVVGSFNYWLKPKNGQIDVKNKESDKWSMKRDKDNVWKLTCLLDFGEHEYKFIIDGERWVPDGINNNCKINIVNPRTSNSNAKAAMSLNPPKTNPAPMPSKILSVPVFQQGQPVSRQESVIDYANDAKDLNIANKYEDISYQLQAHDINYVADILFSKIGDKYFLPVQQYHLNHPSMDLKRTLRENREKLESGIELLSIFNKGGNHWVAFKVKKVGEKQLRVLYKDSFGHKYPPNFKDLIEGCFDKNYTVYFTYSISEEQNLSDGINCGIFAVRNLQVLANQGLADMLGDGEPGLSEGVMNARIKFFNMDVDDYLAAIRQDRHLFANLYLQRSKEIENESKERKDRITRLDNEVTNLMVISLMRNDYFQGLLTGSNKLLSLGFCSLPNSAGICFSINIYGKLIDSLPSFKQFLQNLSTPFTLTMEPGNTCTHFYIPYDDAIRLKSSMENNPREIDDLARALQNVGPPRLTL